MLVVTPKSIDETLLDEVIDKLSLLDQEQDDLLLVSLVIIYILFELTVKVSPVKAPHTLYAVCKVVWCSYV